MDRRGFLGRLGLLPLAIKGAWSGHKQAVSTSIPIVREREQFYQYIRAVNTLEHGTPVYSKDRIIGFAMGHIDRGNYGFIQIYQPGAGVD